MGVSRKWWKRGATAPLVALVFAACSDGDKLEFFEFSGGGTGGTESGSAGTGGSNAGTGGTSAGTGGSSAGTGGASAGTGGSSAGTGGSSAGTGGSSAGTGGSSAGTGGSGGIEFESFGVGDPWLFDEESELADFEVEFRDGATGTAAWSAPGEIHVTAQFAEAADHVHMRFTAPWDGSQNTPLDLSDWTLMARVRTAEDTTASGGVQLFSQSSSGWSWVSGDWHSLADLGAATDLEFDFADSTDGSHVLRFGFQIYGTGAGTAHLIVDHIALVRKAVTPGPDGGTAGTGGTGSEPDAGDPPPVDDDAGTPPIDEDAGAPPPVDEDAGSSESPDTGTGGSGGLGYEPLGLGDPWFFSDSAELAAFTPDNATASWEAPGQVRLSGTFPAPNASMKLHFTTPWDGSTNTPYDMTGRVLRARVRLAEGSTATGGVQAYAQTEQQPGWSFTTGGWNDWSGLGSFTDVELPLAATPDQSQVVRIGLQFYATSAGTADLIIDDIRIEPAD